MEGYGKPVGRFSHDERAFRQCQSKNAYSKRTAIKVARRIRKNTGEDIRHYECPRCSTYHIGHPPKR